MFFKFFRIRASICGAILLTGLVFGPLSITRAKEPYHVGLSQITSHPSLDKVKQGILDALRAEGYEEDRLVLDCENAQGNLALSVQIAQKLVSKKPDAVVAIGTPSAQALLKLTKPLGIPLVFASISDPVGAGLVDSLELPGPFATGTRNAPCFKELLALIQAVMGEVQSLGVIWNPSEKNALDLLAVLKVEAAHFHITIHETSATNTLEVLPASQKLARTVQAFFLLQDNTVASALPSVLRVAKAHALPVFASFPEAVESGALLALAPDEYHIGKQTGQMLLQILQGARLEDIPVEQPKHMGLYLNLGTAKSLQLSLPDDLIKKAQAVYP
jgi:putative ABC transport system substrate-binding protein